ncbi:hypothetical protein [Morganella psychrotolerans]|uniref:DUF2190 family protein n=1 Tax=Morganella psychrotolerans TaxID=368603 RepID=A0A1B8HRA8_9GAMM|nr:hypothetical protein [Morganella psychrotolerans]OBU12172.1 hypothetical protein AYY18_16740 [Morganella psychrotolerans]
MDRNTAHRDGELFAVAVAAGARIYGGHMVCTDASGFAVPGAAGLPVLGVSDDFADNRDGAQGDTTVMVRRGLAFHLNNDSAKPVTQAHIGKPCDLKDSTTVCAGAEDSAAPAGRVLEVTTDGVWVLTA